MCNDECGGVQSLGFCVRDRIAQEVLVDLHGLDRPASRVSRSLVLLGLCVMSNASCKSNKRHSGLEGKHIVAKLECLLHIHSVSGVGNLTAMFEVDTKVGSSRFGRFFRDLGFYGVSHHFDR